MSLALLNTVVVLGCSKSLGSLFFLNSDISTPPLAVGLATPKFGGTLIRTLISVISEIYLIVHIGVHGLYPVQV